MQKTFLILVVKPTNNEGFLYYNRRQEKTKELKK